MILLVGVPNTVKLIVPIRIRETDDTLEGMSLTPYGKGFLLTCHKDDPDYGIEYLYGKTADSGGGCHKETDGF